MEHFVEIPFGYLTIRNPKKTLISHIFDKKKQLSQHDQEQHLPGQHTIYVLTSKLNLALKGQTLNLVTHVTLGLKVLLEKKTLINNSSLG